MDRVTGRRVLAIGVAVLVVVGGGTAWAVGRGLRSPAAASPWQVLPHAFTDRWGSGPRTLVADAAGCFHAFGADPAAGGPATWRASGDCTGPVDVAPRPVPVGDSPPGDDSNGVVAAVAAPDGGYLLVTRHRYAGDAYAYDSAVLGGSPERGWRRLAAFRTDTPRTSHIGPTALSTVPGGYVAVGHRDGTAVAWRSTDGTRWQESVLPLAEGRTGASVTAVTADPQGRLVAVGTSGGGGTGHATGWVSTDGGATWRLAAMPATGGSPQLWSVLHTGSGYLALGGVDGELRAPALVLTSADGVRWQRDDAAARAGARVLTAATVTPDGVVYAVSGNGVNAASADQQCATAWRLDGHRWAGEDLRCHGVPTALAALAGGRVAAVHPGALFLRAGLA